MHETRTLSPGLTFLTRGPDGLNGTDRFMTEDASVGYDRDVPLEYVQIRAADSDGIDPDDGVRVGEEPGFGTSSHAFRPHRGKQALS